MSSGLATKSATTESRSALARGLVRGLITSETSRQTGLLFGAQLASTVLNAALAAVIARSLGKDNYGLFTFCSVSVIQFINYFFEFGVFAAGARLLALERGSESARQLLGALLTLAAIIGGLFAITIVAASGVIDPLYGTSVRDVLLLAAPLAASLPLQLFLEQACQGLNRIGTLSLLRVLLPGISLLLVIACKLLFDLTIMSALVASLLGITITCMVVAVLLKPSFTALAINARKILAETRRFGFDIYFGRITTMVSTRLDSVLIPAILGSTALGYYNLAQKFADPLTNLSRSMAITRFKTFANEATVKRSIVEFNLLLVGAGALALAVVGPYALVLIYSNEFSAATELLLPFAVAAFFGGLFQPYNGFLSAHGRGGELRNISVVIGAINVVSLIFIIPYFGVKGAAWMAAAASAFNFSLHYYYYRNVCRQQVRERRRRVTLVDLSNDARTAMEHVRTRFGEVDLELINKSEVRAGSQLERLRQLRERERDSFIIFCDRLEWQTRQTPMLIFGMLAGAADCWIIDGHGRARGRSRTGILLLELPHMAVEALGSFLVVAVSWLLTRLLALTVRQNPLKWRARADGAAPRIIFIRTTPTSGAQTGGSNSHITGFTNGAVAEGASLSFISNDAISGVKREVTPIEVIEPSPFFNAHRMIFELWNNIMFTARALPLVERARPDFIYQRYSRFSWAGVAISHLTGIPLILEYNGSEVWIGRHWDDVSLLWLLVGFEQLNLDGAQYIFVVSDVEKRNLMKAGVKAEKIFVNPNGVDPEMFKPGVGGEGVRKELGIDDKVVIGFVGTFGPWHGVLALAEAIVRMPRTSNCHFLLVGEGSLKGQVEQIVSEHDALDRVTFTGRLSHRLVPAYLDACDILVSPHVPMEDGSEFFGSPTKLFEYMAMAKPVVASRLGQIADVIKDNSNGLLIEPGQIEMLVNAIERLAADKHLRQSLGAQARLDAIAHYTWQQNAARVINAYKERKN